MVQSLGMSEKVGPRNVGGIDNAYIKTKVDPTMSENLRKKVDDEVDAILTEQYERGMAILEKNEHVLEGVAKLLIEKEKITGLELLSKMDSIKPGLIAKEAMRKAEEFEALGKTALRATLGNQ